MEFCYCFPDGRTALLCVSHQADVCQNFPHFALLCLMTLSDRGQVHTGSVFVFQGPFADVHYQVPPDAMVYRDPWLLEGFTVALYVPKVF